MQANTLQYCTCSCPHCSFCALSMLQAWIQGPLADQKTYMQGCDQKGRGVVIIQVTQHCYSLVTWSGSFCHVACVGPASNGGFLTGNVHMWSREDWIATPVWLMVCE